MEPRSTESNFCAGPFKIKKAEKEREKTLAGGRSCLPAWNPELFWGGSNSDSFRKPAKSFTSSRKIFWKKGLPEKNKKIWKL